MSNGGWVTAHEDITERRSAAAKISFMALHDALTNLPNRQLFQEQIENRLARLPRDRKFAIFCLDIDRFKSVNDTLGHLVGDKLLRQVAERISGCLGEGEMPAVGRWPVDKANSRLATIFNYGTRWVLRTL